MIVYDANVFHNNNCDRLESPPNRSDNLPEVLMPAPIVQILEAADYAQQVRRGAGLLGDGKLVVLPTETVYGATALLTRPAARDQLRALRPAGRSKPMTPHLADW